MTERTAEAMLEVERDQRIFSRASADDLKTRSTNSITFTQRKDGEKDGSHTEVGKETV